MRNRLLIPATSKNQPTVTQQIQNIKQNQTTQQNKNKIPSKKKNSPPPQPVNGPTFAPFGITTHINNQIPLKVRESVLKK